MEKCESMDIAEKIVKSAIVVFNKYSGDIYPHAEKRKNVIYIYVKDYKKQTMLSIRVIIPPEILENLLKGENVQRVE